MSNSIRIGPSGLGSVKDAISNLENYQKLGFKAVEIAFTYNIYIKKDDAIKIGQKAKELDIKLSIHAPFFINLNSKEKEKIEASKQRILKCCEIGNYLEAKNIVFHSGFYLNNDKEKTYNNIKEEIIGLQKEIKKNNWDVELCPEIMGKINVFGSIDEISRLAQETACSFTIDFAHILARYKQDMFDEVIEKFPQKNWHCHFSGIEYNEKGERRHIDTNDSDWEKLLKILIKLDKNITIINESPDPIKCAKMGVNFLN